MYFHVKLTLNCISHKKRKPKRRLKQTVQLKYSSWALNWCAFKSSYTKMMPVNSNLTFEFTS